MLPVTLMQRGNIRCQQLCRGLTLILIRIALPRVAKVTVTTGKTLLTMGATLLLWQCGFGIGARVIRYRFWELG